MRYQGRIEIIKLNKKTMIMNKIVYKIFTAVTVALVMTMTGCLKDSDYSNNNIGTKNTQNQNFVEVHLTTQDNSNFVLRAYDPINHDTTVTKLIPIHLTSGPASSDLTVTYKLLNDTLTDAIIDSMVNIEGCKLLDPTVFTPMNQDLKVTIPAGSSTAYVSVKFKPGDFLGNIYIFGIQITAVSDPKYTISNLDKGYIKWSIKNQWDGDYHCVGYRKHPSLGILPVDRTETLITVDATTVIKSGFGDYPYDMTIQITTDKINVAGTDCYKCIVHVIDPNTKAPVASGEGMYTTFTGDPSSAPIPLTNDVNYYNPVTKTFVLNAYYNSAAPRGAYEVLTRL